MLTEADLFFPKEKVAVFCDGSKHHIRGKDRAKDERINFALREMGITPVRISGTEIRTDLKAAGDKVCDALNET
jgi:very-short-patch-repair endonuclease